MALLGTKKTSLPCGNSIRQAQEAAAVIEQRMSQASEKNPLTVSKDQDVEETTVGRSPDGTEDSNHKQSYF